jgi:hypothetical protein
MIAGGARLEKLCQLDTVASGEGGKDGRSEKETLIIFRSEIINIGLS